MAKIEGSTSNVWAWIKLVVTLAVFSAIFVGIRFGVAAYNAALSSTKQNLQARGVNVSADGVSVKTDRRALTVEETQDKLQRCVPAESRFAACESDLRFTQIHHERMEVGNVFGPLAPAKDDQPRRLEARQGQGRVGEEA